MGNHANETYYRASEEINKIRKKKGITVKDFAEAFGKQYGNVSSALYRNTKLFNEEELDDISAYLGVPKSRLMVNPTGFVHGRRNNFESLFLLKAPATNRKELTKEEDKPMTLEINTGNTKFYEEVKPTDAMQELLDEEKAEYEEIRDNYRKLKAENASLKAEVELCDRFKKEAQEENKNLKEVIEALKKENKNNCQIAIAAQNELSELRMQNDKLGKKIEALQNELKEVNEELEYRKKLYEDTVHDLDLEEETNEQLKSENEALKSDMFDLLWDHYRNTKYFH